MTHFRFKNFEPEEVSIGAEPWGHYIPLQPGETINVEGDGIEDITVAREDEGDKTVIAIWAKGSLKFIKNNDVIFEY